MTPDYETAQLAYALTEAGHTVRVDEFNTILIEHDVFDMWIEKRNWYCDRGKWQWNASSKNVVLATVDSADMFPRHYFHDDCLVRELTAWLEVRMRNVNKKR